MTFKKKIGFTVTGLLISIFAVIGTILYAQGEYTTSVRTGIGLIVIPAIIVVPLLYLLFTSVFEKQPLFAVILLALKALGYVIAVAGFALCVTVCQPKHGSVLIAGLAIMGAVAAIGLIYIIIIGSNLKDHQPPRKAVEESLNDKFTRPTHFKIQIIATVPGWCIAASSSILSMLHVFDSFSTGRLLSCGTGHMAKGRLSTGYEMDESKNHDALGPLSL
ncbi:putative CD47 antigen protein [Naja naja]|nr:putative CD47 antigen protein [Naja naja]